MSFTFQNDTVGPGWDNSPAIDPLTGEQIFPADVVGGNIAGDGSSILAGGGDMQNATSLNSLQGDMYTNSLPSMDGLQADGGYQQNAIVFPTEFDGMTDLNNGLLFKIYSEESASVGANSRTMTQSLPSMAEDLGALSPEEQNMVEQQNAMGPPSTVTEQAMMGSADQLTSDFNSITTSNARMVKKTARSEDTICLYMPATVSTTDSWQWEMTDFKKKTLGQFIQGDIAGAAQALEGAATGYLAGFLQENADQVSSAMRRVVANPRKEQLFSEPNQRTFSFTFNFVPKTEEDSRAAKDVINTFKLHAAPKLREGSYNLLSYPSEFEIIYFGPEGQNHWLNTIKRCALTSISVNYQNAAVISMFNNGAPTNMEVTLDFAEMELLHRDVYKADLEG